MNDYENIKCLGKGGFGTANLVKRKKDGKHFALKTIKARGLNGMTKHEKDMAKKEADVLRQINFIFIVK